MISLFTKSSLALLQSLSFTKTLFAFDFDGTLAKTVTNPADAIMSPTTEQFIKELSELVPVAIISGRSVQDLKRRLKFKPQYLVGNHGIEGAKENELALAASQTMCNKWLKHLQSHQFEDGVKIEDKTYSLSVHFREAHRKKLAKKQIVEAISALQPSPRIITGKSVFNIVPPSATLKGSALLELVQKSGAKHVFYIGDDETDEDIFGLSYMRGQLMSVRVGQKKSSRAKFFIQRQSEINRLLSYLIEFHQPKR